MSHTDEIDLLRSLGPAPARLEDATLARARTALLAGIDREQEPAGPCVVRHGLRRRVLAGGLVAAAVAAFGLLAPSLLGRGEVALARTDPLTFPVTPTSLPSGIGDPVFEVDPGFSLARYGTGESTLTVIAPDSLAHWTMPTDAQHVLLDDHDALAFRAEPNAFTVAWEEDDGQVLGVTGRGRYAAPDEVEAVARSLVERPQRVPLELTLAPRGWEVSSYRSDRGAELSGDGEHLSVSLLTRLSPGLEAYAATDVSTVDVSGHPGLVGRQGSGDGWVLEGRTTDGQAFSVLAPASLTRDEVVDLARGIRHRG